MRLGFLQFHYFISLSFFFPLPFGLKGVFNGEEINLGTDMKRCNIIKRDIMGDMTDNIENTGQPYTSIPYYDTVIF